MITNNITVLLHGGHTVDATNVLIYEASLCVCCIIMYLVLHYLSRNYSSMIIKSELYLWKVDIVRILDNDCTFETIKHFGFQSGRDVDKFGNITPPTDCNDVPYLGWQSRACTTICVLTP